jgi:hypothetical protein
MRCTFNIELRVDINSTDDALRKAFIDMMLMKARELYGPAAMLAKTTPLISASIISATDGKVELPLFSRAELGDDNSAE